LSRRFIRLLFWVRIKRGQATISYLFGRPPWFKLMFMEYKGVCYTIRIGIEPGQWAVAIFPLGRESPIKKIVGTRADAHAAARSMINHWLQGRPKLRQPLAERYKL
jgi:hypothetical protein